ncbi:hypothetical protein [Paenibacillus tepidiphilus]|uniref:hypothetical protein n=1 Tax=Paenibacillus tepidiphilus TaxID=2608683 RepID=UPI00123B33C0|nr:hypothetical protein [Paenibacillus tepidiphilus]
MDKLIGELEQLTIQIISNIEVVTQEELENFVAERQRIIDAIGTEVESSPFNAAQKDKLARIMSHDSAIVARMNAYRLDALEGLQKRNQAKMQRSAYESAYTPDSILMDRRK